MPTPAPQSKSAPSTRPPVVVVMGHIDHGKSTLLDHIRKSNVVAGEAGGITQHVGAYQVEHISADGKKHPITFLDTPGHEAFCSIRERGAAAADVAILVVSAEDGVKPQTVEAFKDIQDGHIPFIVAISKIDKPNANIEKAKTSLGEHEIYVEGWGGDIPCVEISALTGKGMPELLDMIMLVSEIADLKADTAAPAEGVVIESTLDTRKGVSATLLVKNGTLSTGSFVVAGGSFAPVRFIEDFKGDKIESAGPSAPAVVLGWNIIPACGVHFVTLKNKKEAEKLAEQQAAAEKSRKASAAAAGTGSVVRGGGNDERAGSLPVPRSSGEVGEDENKPEIVTVPLIIKADVIGSLEGVRHELEKIRHDKVHLKIVSEGIGEINEKDVKTAAGDPSIILIGFNAAPDKKSAALIERSPVPIMVKNFSIIYELSNFVKETLMAKVPKEYVEESTGTAKILALFSKDKDKQVVGGKVQSGTIETGNDVKIMRRETEIGRGKIRELQQAKKRATEVREGFEFGMLVDSKVELAAGDKVEAVRTVEKK